MRIFDIPTTARPAANVNPRVKPGSSITGSQTPFFKSMAAEKNPGVRMDVYHLPYHGRTIYVKFVRDPNGTFALSSFKEK